MTPQEAILKECAEAKQILTESLINRIWRNNSTLIYSGSTEARIILDALEKQIPKKPTYTGEKNVYGGVVRICNECGDGVCISPMAKEYENYCRSCGKRLTDWSDTK